MGDVQCSARVNSIKRRPLVAIGPQTGFVTACHTGKCFVDLSVDGDKSISNLLNV